MAKSFDLFWSPVRDFRIQTVSGGVVSITGFSLLILLVLSEFYLSISGQAYDRVSIDQTNQSLVKK